MPNRYAIALTSSLLALLVALAALADPPQNQWNVTAGQVGNNSVHVTVGATVGPGNYCGQMAADAEHWQATIKITPCPLSKTCTNGTYTANYGQSSYYSGTFSPSDTLSLQCGVNYTIQGTWSFQMLMYIGGPMPVPCEAGGTMTTTYFLDAATPSRTHSWGRLKSMYR